MTAHQTKFFKLKEVSFPILLWIVGVSVALVLHVFGVFSHAKPIENEDKVTVDGVENVVQYLTSLVLHAPWTSSQLITIQYDGGIDALRVNGRVNADALVIDAGQVNNNSSVEGNAVFWWMGNRVDGQTSNNLIVGWENNTINFARLNGAIPGRFWVSQGGGSVVIGSAKSEIRTSDNVLNIGTTNSSFSNKTRNVAAIGWQVVAQDVENSVAFWAGKKTLASNSILLGKSINAGGKNQIFVWSDSDEEFAPEHSNAFYVNAANGFGLNTTAPRTKLDLGNVGVLKIAKTEPKNCSQSSAGVTSYAGSVFCGCDGKEWIPLTSDMTPEKVAACKTLGKVKCIGTINTDSNATNMWESSAYSRWNHESDKREPMGWKYSSKDKLGACEYNCKIWFHPGANDPEGWLQVWACKACSEVVNKFRWKTAGTGNDNCDFTCKASFKYTNSSTQRTCSDCEVGTYTENDNQDKVCKNCNAPERLSTGTISPSFWTHYYTFDTKGTGKNACDFTCDARYAYFFNGKGKHDSRDSLSADLGSQALDLGISVGRGEGWKGGIGTNPLPGQGTPLIKKDWVKMWTSFFPVSYNACVYCKVGTWSAGWKSKECTNCTNKQENIDYWVDNVKGTLSGFSTYIGNGSANDCDWKCDANKGLEKHGDICKCRANTHLEWGTCIANTSNGQCNLRRQPSGNWVKIWATTYSRIWNPDLDNPNYKGTWSAPATKSWVYVENATSLSPCQWSCATGYEPSGNTCVKKAVAVTGACAQNVTVPIDGTKLVDYAQANSSLFCSPGTLINPVILNGKLEWKCAWLNGWKPSPTCRVSCPANYTLQNGACVKPAAQYEWKCIEANKEGYCDLPMENKDIRNWSGFQNENGPDWHYDTAHKWCFFSTREDCEKHECEWRSGGNPLSLGEIPVCADKSAPNDRSKDSKNREADCKVPIPHCWSAWECESSCELIDERWCQEKRLDRNYSESGYRCWIKQGGTYIWRYNDWWFYNWQSNTVWGGSYPWGKCTYCAVSSYFKDVCDVPSGQKIPDYCAWVNAMPISKDCSGNSKKECEGATEAEQRKKWYCSWESNYVCKKNGRIVADVECAGKVKPKNCGETTPVAYSCLGSLPVNAIANNSNKPTSSNKNYFYSTNASEPCSFQCKEGYNWKDGFCVKNVKYEWKCIYHDPSGLGGKCVLKSSDTTPSEKWCLQQLPEHDVRCDKSWRWKPYTSCTIRLKGDCSYSKENCEKCKGELGGGKPYWFEGVSFDRCKDIKTQEECGSLIDCKWENNNVGFVPREFPVCVDKSAPNDRSKDSKNPDIDCKDPAPVCVIWHQKIEYERYCSKWENNGKKEPKCREKWSGMDAPLEKCKSLLIPLCFDIPTLRI